MKKAFLLLIIFSIIGLSIVSKAQNTRELHGRVVEVLNTKMTGISNIKVSVPNIDNYYTNEKGEFILNIPTDKKYVNIILEGTNKQMISPYSGLINLPPNGQVEIRVCAQENKRLREEVDKLNKKVKSFQVKYEVSNRKAAGVYQEMLDTIVFYELRIQNLDAQKAAMQKEYIAEINRLQAEIDRLKSVETSLMQQLLEAKDEKFKQKQAVYQKITAGLRRYADELQNLNDMLLPEVISFYFAYDNKAAVDKLSAKVEAYNAAYHGIDDNRDGHISAVRHYWEDEEIVRQLTETYQYLLVDVHEKIIYPMKSTVIETIRQWGSRQDSRNKLENKAKVSSTDVTSKIKVKNTILLDKINETINLLKQNF